MRAALALYESYWTRWSRQDSDLPEGCSVTYELESVEILENLLKPARPEAALEAFYEDFLERHGVRPTAVEGFHQGLNPRGSSERSWLGFVSRMNGLSEAEATVFSHCRTFLDDVERIETARSYEIVLLLGMLSANAMPGEIEVDSLVEQVRKIAARYLKIKEDFSAHIDDPRSLRRLLIENPIRNLVNGPGTRDIPFFRFEKDRLSTTFNVGDIESFQRTYSRSLGLASCAVPQSTGLSKCNRRHYLPGGPQRRSTSVLVATKRCHSSPLGTGSSAGSDRRAALRCYNREDCHQRRPDTRRRCEFAPQILRSWFGDEAGLPGHNDRIRLKRGPSGFEMEALRILGSQKLQVWERYPRDAIAPAFGFVFSQAIWNAGFVVQDPEVFLLVTLAKHDMNTEHRYVDQFVSDSEFAWQSQNRTTKASKHGQLLRNHLATGKRVHLFVRPTKKTGSKPTSFIYCGEVDFVSWEGDAPISIRWRLRRLGTCSTP